MFSLFRHNGSVTYQAKRNLGVVASCRLKLHHNYNKRACASFARHCGDSFWETRIRRALATAAASSLLFAPAVVRGQVLDTPSLGSAPDPFGGIAVNVADLPNEAASFVERLDQSLSAWRSRRVRGVWLKIPIEKSHLISHAVERGFVFHHAEKQYCMLTLWLPRDEPNPLPANASTQVGVGALVVNDEGQVLLVQEAVGPSAGKGVWKIPTGLLNAREEIVDGVVRECFEETGVEAEFEKVLAFRHAHTALFGKSDIFVVCLLRAKTTMFKLQTAEIARAKWADFEDFLQQAPYPRDTPMWASFYRRCVGEDGVVGNVKGIGFERVPISRQPGAVSQYIFS
eukprot:TRINITY_DN21743_c0_g1_i1.p1 TRINITY_DN21743_c0_g1~~TRINITY_DN21743_c0_g1_i1.p1  ORF type:complete len:342 (-),score=34.23 TRINITY_DN21743_c0_g1_i1:67-1092(-)